MLAKLASSDDFQPWYKFLDRIEYSINNTINCSTGKSPSQLVFSFDQRSPCPDRVRDHLDDLNSSPELNVIRDEALPAFCDLNCSKSSSMTKDTVHPKNIALVIWLWFETLKARRIPQRNCCLNLKDNMK